MGFWYALDMQFAHEAEFTTCRFNQQEPPQWPPAFRAVPLVLSTWQSPGVSKAEVPSGNLLHSCGKSQFLMGKSSINGHFLYSYVTNYQRIIKHGLLENGPLK